MKANSLLMILFAASLSGCVAPVPVGGPSVGIGYYSTLPGDWAGDYYFVGGRYYYGGRYEHGDYLDHGHHYHERYVHGGHTYYGGRFGHAAGHHH